MMVTHHAYNTVKLPGNSGTITVRSDEKDATRSIEHAFKDAAAAFTGAEEDLEPSAAPTKKKKLFTEERTATKKVSLDANGSGATAVVSTDSLGTTTVISIDGSGATIIINNSLKR